jgi:adenosine kinase
MIDPTGAGDAWRGGFIAGLLMGSSTRDCLKLGNVMASFAIEKYGTVNHKPTRKEIEKRLKSL